MTENMDQGSRGFETLPSGSEFGTLTANGNCTWLWPRWLMLRAVGLVCVIIFSGILREYRALIGPEGLAPLSDLMATLRDTHPNLAAARLGLAAAQDQLGIMLLSGEARPRFSPGNSAPRRLMSG